MVELEATEMQWLSWQEQARERRELEEEKVAEVVDLKATLAQVSAERCVEERRGEERRGE